jgi:hypothetical protein
MNMHVDVQEFESGHKKPGLFRRMLELFAKLLSGAKGEQGGWESGARGL